MNATIGIEQLNNLRNEFKEYLREMNPHWNDAEVSAINSDAFFILKNDIGIDLWTSMASEESLLTVRDLIRDYLASTKGSDRSDERADNYLSALRQLKTFLDNKHPALPAEWSGKAISDVNLKSDFQAWMKKQKKSNGESYSPNTVSAYTTALKNSTTKLRLGNAVNSDLFYYTSLDEFEAAHRAILAAPNFEEVDIAAGNKAYSNGMILYARFLKELDEPSAWIFQGNPKIYDVVAAIEKLDTLTWSINQYKKQIKKGDVVYIWVSGSDGGIIASGSTMCDPEKRKQDPSDPYNRGYITDNTPRLMVDIRIEKKFIHEKVSRALLLADERTKQLDILTYPGATNFSVTKTQQAVIESIINGNYARVSAADDPKTEITGKRHYWLYAPGEQARLWDEFYNNKIMGIGWDLLGDIARYSSKTDVKSMLKQKYGDDRSYMNDGLAVWQFANDISIGDIIIVKKGSSLVLGRGIVTSDYRYDSNRNEYKHIREVKWTHKDEWKHPGQAVQKTLTDITRYTEYVEKLEALFIDGEESLTIDEPEINYDEYTEANFLNDVYMSEKNYLRLKEILLRKKNVILQGAPGVGKTFAAHRLAFSIMGKKDTSRVKIIQFHQSYSYEDFIMGYRPDGSGFRLTEGPFYEFCKKAESDDEEYFFIIDEINRGNLSKIFGELLMLIESDKRGDNNAIRLLYRDEQFSVPANIHIIGMMNTADRSLAMIDYALRRRFAFFNMEPAFSSEGFKTYQTKIQNPKFDALVSAIESLNKVIGEDTSLGMGFRIGHSYFCTNDIINDTWLSSIIEYELVPLLHEYWFDEPSKIESWTNRLRDALNG